MREFTEIFVLFNRFSFVLSILATSATMHLLHAFSDDDDGAYMNGIDSTTHICALPHAHEKTKNKKEKKGEYGENSHHIISMSD